jgi:hypothetical protein
MKKCASHILTILLYVWKHTFSAPLLSASGTRLATTEAERRLHIAKQ